MTNSPRYASLYQINTRVWLTELSGALGKHATLDDIPDAETRDAIVRLAAATLVPIVPLLLTMMPLEELLKKLIGVLF